MHNLSCYKAMMTVDNVALGLTSQMQILPSVQELPVACKLCAYGCCNHRAHTCY